MNSNMNTSKEANDNPYVFIATHPDGKTPQKNYSLRKSSTPSRWQYHIKTVEEAQVRSGYHRKY